VLWNMTGGAGGRQPLGLPVVASDGTLYGATYMGGSGFGNVLALTLPDTRPVLVQTIPSQTATVGTPFSYSFPANTFSNSDIGQGLNYSVTNLPGGIGFDSVTRTFSGSPTGVGSFQVGV